MANAKTTPIQIDRTVFTIGLGTKGVRRTMGGTVSFDVTKLPPHIVAFLVERGADIMLRQASAAAEDEQLDEWKAKPGNKGKEPPPIAKFPFDLVRFEQTAVAAMRKRVEQWYAGETGRSAAPMNALDRRAAELIEAGLRHAFAHAKKPVPDADQLAAIIQRVLGDPEKGAKYREAAKAQLLAEQEAAQKGAGDLASLVA